MSGLPIILEREWFELIDDGVDRSKCGIYRWEIAGAGVYIGKFGRVRRPLKEYGRNVTRLLNGNPYRRSKPDGFRRVHRELARAYQHRRKITLTLLENCDPSKIDAREDELIKLHGSLNDPPFGHQISK